MKVLVTGSSGHLGEALVRTLRAGDVEVVGLDVLASAFTAVQGSIMDRALVKSSMQGVDAVIHAASLHKPHLVTHSKQAFIDVNVTGTLVLLEEAVEAGVKTFLYTSTTSAFGQSLHPSPGSPAAWITEDTPSIPKNMYGLSKVAAEGLCEIFHGKGGMSCMSLRTSRFFPEEDDRRAIRDGYDDANAKANEFLYRRVDVEDVVTAHLRALERAASLPFERYVISATTPFEPSDLAHLGIDAPSVLARHFPSFTAEYARRGWTMFPTIDRVYVNAKARTDLGWRPRHDFASVLARLAAGEDPRSRLAQAIGSKGYHEQKFADGPFPVQ
ncbi:MAG TPA: NAD(P)-dependent oxidoreductase [Usitatibacter sp.]|nr:NAD(P)-dependent oxidoreductase [Usitatibacter sp.]